MTPDIVSLARAEAGRRLLANAGPLGLLASAEAYQQVWTRDAAISTLGLLCLDTPEAAALSRRSLDTVARFQTPLGNLPHNVGYPGVHDPALVAEGGALAGDGDGDAPVVDTAHAGCIDGALWYILATYLTFERDGDLQAIVERLPVLARAYRWLQYQDSNECGLLEVHEAMDWADLFANHYNSLGPNVLWYAVHRALQGIADAAGPGAYLERSSTYADRAEGIRFRINTLLWVGPEFPRDLAWVRANRKEWLHPIQATDQLLQERPYYLPYVAFRGWADRFDTFGNLLAIIFGVTDDRQTGRVLDFIEAAGVAEPWPILAVTPPVQPGEADWREYYRIRNLNQPDQYHNGGAWPFLGGFYVAALVRAGRYDVARSTLVRLAEMNRCGRSDWGFHEWFHGRSGRPMGFAGQSWSMAMYLYADDAVRRGACAGFETSVWAGR